MDYESHSPNEPYPEGPVYVSYMCGECQVHGCAAHTESICPSMTVQSYVSVHTTRTRKQSHMMYGIQKNTFSKESSRNSNANMDTTAMSYAKYTIVGEFYVCGTCKKPFTCKGNLIRHFRIHTAQKTYVCGTCKKAFSQKSHMQRHLRIHTGEKLHACSVCGKVFSQREHMQTHYRTHSGVKPYACDLCSKSFSVKCNLTSHTRVHTGEKPFVCIICNKAFTQRIHLNRHEQIHSEE